MKKANVTIHDGTDQTSPTLDDVRRTLRDELLDVARRHVEPTVRTPMPSASEWNDLTAAYVRLGGNLELEPVASRRELMLAEERAAHIASDLGELLNASRRVVLEAQGLGPAYFEGDVYGDLRAALTRLAGTIGADDEQAA